MADTIIDQIRTSAGAPVRLLHDELHDHVLWFDQDGVTRGAFIGSTPGEVLQAEAADTVAGGGRHSAPQNTAIRWAMGNELWVITKGGLAVGYIDTRLPRSA